MLISQIPNLTLVSTIAFTLFPWTLFFFSLWTVSSQMPRYKDESPAVRVYTVCDESRSCLNTLFILSSLQFIFIVKKNIELFCLEGADIWLWGTFQNSTSLQWEKRNNYICCLSFNWKLGTAQHRQNKLPCIRI